MLPKAATLLFIFYLLFLILTKMVPEKVAHYQILRKLGQGGMGEVFLARDTKLGRDVAIKILSGELVSNPRFVGRFHQEARLASALKHHGVAEIYEIGESEGIHFIAMEHVEGETLAAGIKKGKRNLNQALEWAVQIAEILKEAHSKKVTHRDLKPENIMVTPEGKIKILDFGIAKLSADLEDSNITTQVVTETGTTMGTTFYMSPEQALGMEVDHRSDIFSFGTLLYELTTRRRPFESVNLNAVVNQIIHEIPFSPHSLNSEIPPDLDHIIMKCLRKSPEERYQGVVDLIADLHAVRRQISGEKGITSLAKEPEYRIPRKLARFLFAAIQLLYLGMYLAALYWSAPMHNAFANLFGDSIATPLTIVYVLSAMVGIAIRLHLLGLILWDHVTTGVQFRKIFVPLFILDILWAFAPFSLSLKVSEIFVLACIPPLVFLPFSQRTLIRSAYDLFAPRRIKTSN